MNINALDFHREEQDWTEEDGEFFACLEKRLAHLLQLSIKEREEFFGGE